MTTPRTRALRDLAQRLVDDIPPEVVEEAVLTGSVSRGVADEVSDIEMLLVTPEQLDLETCFGHARAAGLTGLDTWGVQGTPANRVFGYREGVPLELIWWSREYAESSVDALFGGEPSATGDALAHGVTLRTTGLLASWQERLAGYPDELAAVRIEDAALPWGGFHAAGLLTLIRPGERLALVEWIFDGASRVLRILYALNRVWPPSHKRLATRVEALAVKPERLAERIQEALTAPDPRKALLLLTELQADTVALAPDGPNVNRARIWLAEGAELLRRAD